MIDLVKDDPHDLTAVIAIGDSACERGDGQRLAAAAHLLGLCLASTEAVDLFRIEEVARVDVRDATRLWAIARRRVQEALFGDTP